jgi:hypothetical protein
VIKKSRLKGGRLVLLLMGFMIKAFSLFCCTDCSLTLKSLAVDDDVPDAGPRFVQGEQKVVKYVFLNRKRKSSWEIFRSYRL